MLLRGNNITLELIYHNISENKLVFKGNNYKEILVFNLENNQFYISNKIYGKFSYNLKKKIYISQLDIY